MKEIINYNWLKERNLILYEVISGSIAYGTNLPTSDEDRRYVYILPIEYILNGNIIEQVNDETNDVVGYEIGRFLNLIASANPNLLELLNMPDHCIIHKDPVFDLVLNQKDKFLTKKCKNSFAGYAYSQISKAKGQNKKQNWEKDKVTRKDILDFVYVIENEKSIPWKIWNTNYDEKFCGVVNIPNARDLFCVYYDTNAHLIFSELVPEEIRAKNKIEAIQNGQPMGFGYKGIIKEEDSVTNESNALRLSSIPKDEKPICIISYNKDSYSQHCKDYSSYLTWLEKRNEARWVDVKSHNQKIDGKNMMHCVRLTQMAKEIGEGRGIIVHRNNAKELIDIRKGAVNLDDIISNVENEIKNIDKIFDNSNLPNDVNKEDIYNLILNIRKSVYNN